MKTDLLNQFNKYIQDHHLFNIKDKLLLAVSGGADSVVLCALCKQAGFDFIIAHCNFNLRAAESERDEKFVQELAEKLEVPFFVKSFNTKSIAFDEKKSIETAARDLRYEWFHQLINQSSISPINFIVTAHHADDNIETTAMNFFRGTGIAGVRGILPKQGIIRRPLLFARRSQIEQFANEQQIDFVTDSSNLESDFTRNFFRNKIIPLIQSQYPEAENNVLHNISRFTDIEKIYLQSIAQQKKKLMEQQGNEIHIPVLKLQKTVGLFSVMYEILKTVGFTAQQVPDAIALLKSDSGKFIQSASHRLIKNRKWLIITPLKTNLCQNVFIEKEEASIEFEAGKIQFKTASATNYNLQAGNQIAQLDLKEIKFPLLLRKWKQGDYFYPLGMQKKKKLSRFFIDQKLSITQKENTWVLETDKKIIWVLGLRIDNRFKITEATKNILELKLSVSE